MDGSRLVCGFDNTNLLSNLVDAKENLSNLVDASELLIATRTTFHELEFTFIHHNVKGKYSLL